MELNVIIDNYALFQPKAACNYISLDSPKNGLKVRKDILTTCQALTGHPEGYPIDKYKTNNYGSYRAFELHHYRVVYRVGIREVRILNIRYTSMLPLVY
mgnify:CR=1 FL=1